MYFWKINSKKISNRDGNIDLIPLFVQKKIFLFRFLLESFFQRFLQQTRGITAVEVSRETGKNLPAVKQQTFCDLIMTIIRFFRTRMPALLIGRFTQGPENTALPTFTLCRIKLSQLYVKIKS